LLLLCTQCPKDCGIKLHMQIFFMITDESRYTLSLKKKGKEIISTQSCVKARARTCSESTHTRACRRLQIHIHIRYNYKITFDADIQATQVQQQRSQVILFGVCIYLLLIESSCLLFLFSLFSLYSFSPISDM